MAKVQEKNTAVDEAPRLRVRATEMGYYDHVRRREGDVFTVDAASYSERWMEKVDPRTPEHVTTGPQDLRKQHEALRADRAPAMMASDSGPTGAKDVLGS